LLFGATARHLIEAIHKGPFSYLSVVLTLREQPMPASQGIRTRSPGLFCPPPSMFGVPNMDRERRTADRRQRSGAAKQRGELDAGIPGAKSLCAY